MFVLIAIGVLIIASIALIIINYNCWDEDWPSVLGTVVLVICLLALLILGSIALTANIGTKRTCYAVEQYKEALEYQLSKIEDGSIEYNSNPDLYNEIVNFNTDIKEHELYENSKWIGIFYTNYSYVGYIEIPSGE